MMLALATVAANAKDVLDAPTWTDNLTTTTEAKDLTRAAAMAVDNEGNSIVTGSFTKDLEFADSYLEPVANSAFIAKYDKAGARSGLPVWLVQPPSPQWLPMPTATFMQPAYLLIR